MGTWINPITAFWVASIVGESEAHDSKTNVADFLIGMKLHIDMKAYLIDQLSKFSVINFGDMTS